MSRGGFKISRQGEHEAATRSVDSNVSGWMKQFAQHAEKYVEAEDVRQKEAVTIVNKSRERQVSIYDQMNAIMNGGKRPLYSSVEEAVDDYQQKTGLKNYLEKIQTKSSLKSVAAQIIAAADEEFVAEEKKSSVTEINDSEPEIFSVYPHIKDFIRNVVDANPSIQIPAVLYTIEQNFARDNVGQYLDDPILARYINSLLKPIKSDTANTAAMLGRGVGLGVVDTPENRDPFHILRNNPSR